MNMNEKEIAELALVGFSQHMGVARLHVEGQVFIVKKVGENEFGLYEDGVRFHGRTFEQAHSWAMGIRDAFCEHRALIMSAL